MCPSNTETSEAIGEGDIIFSSAALAMKKALIDFKRSHLSIKNRLQSILHDANFVISVADAFRFPLVANERCGSWYIPPERKIGSAYFKSTDGHFGQWSFSLRRLNLQVFDILQSHQGCVIVDSTRKGKSMPDALSKTVPIWTCVMNRLLFPEQAEAHHLDLPYDVISNSERAQIHDKLQDFVRDAEALHLDVLRLREKLHQKPMCIVWQRPTDAVPSSAIDCQKHSVIVLCTASCCLSDTVASRDYVQGAADDSESWAWGLTPTDFWRNKETLLSSSDDSIPTLIETIREVSVQTSVVKSPILVNTAGNLWIANNAAIPEHMDNFGMIVICSIEPESPQRLPTGSKQISLHCAAGKVGSRKLRIELRKLHALEQCVDEDTRLLVTCQTGQDLAVGTALAVLCLYYDNNGSVKRRGGIHPSLTKVEIRHRLSWIMTSMPDAAPSRATLQSVNAFLLS